MHFLFCGISRLVTPPEILSSSVFWLFDTFCLLENYLCILWTTKLQLFNSHVSNWYEGLSFPPLYLPSKQSSSLPPFKSVCIHLGVLLKYKIESSQQFHLIISKQASVWAAGGFHVCPGYYRVVVLDCITVYIGFHFPAHTVLSAEEKPASACYKGTCSVKGPLCKI